MPEPEAKIRRIGGYLNRVVPVLDSAGRVIQYVVRPLMVELRVRDLMQIVVGATILAIPVAYTEEAWGLGERLPLFNVVLLGFVSICFVGLFVHYNFYRDLLRQFAVEYAKRVVAIYLLSLVVVAGLLTLIQQAPWGVDPLLAVKRCIIVAFPASMSAAVSDMLK